MGSGFNMPEGVYERDIPGYNDIEVTIGFQCDATEDCGDWDEENVTVDSGGGHEVEAICPVCEITVKQDYDGYEPDYDSRDDYYDNRDYDGPY